MRSKIIFKKVKTTHFQFLKISYYMKIIFYDFIICQTGSAVNASYIEVESIMGSSS